MISKELKKKIDFIIELEKLKTINRENYTLDKNRKENSAEHSWHIAIMALLFEDEFQSTKIDFFKIVKMLLIHDIVEIDAGDTCLYNENLNKNKSYSETTAAQRIFGLLPKEKKDEFINLWNEFENRKTNEAIIAASIDNLQPLINHVVTAKDNYNPLNIKKSKVFEKKEFIKNASENLWQIAKQFIDIGVKKGLYINDTTYEKNTSDNFEQM
jgi:putative hydrolase of HD superfamily